MKIYTGAGDRGETGLFGGARVRKDDPRVEAYGTVDELVAALGWVRATAPTPALQAPLSFLQSALFRLGAELACAPGREQKLGVALIDATDIARVERFIDAAEAELPTLKQFILPGGTAGAAALHLARTICRRAERRIVSVGPGEVDPVLLAYVNRLSDFLFVAARAVNRRAGAPELEW
jgi:cob(I)alamin adenosyltransferase